MCTLPKPPAGRALSEGKEAPQAAFPSWGFPVVLRGSASLLPSHGRGIWPRDVLKKVSRGLSRVEAGNPGLEEAQAGIKIAGRNINNFRYADDTTLMAESEEELKSLLMKVKDESEKLA